MIVLRYQYEILEIEDGFLKARENPDIFYIKSSFFLGFLIDTGSGATMKTLWILGNQLNENLEGFKEIELKRGVILLMESKDRFLWKDEHKQKLVLVFWLCGILLWTGYEVDYREVENFSEGLQDHLANFPSQKFLIHEPTDFRIKKK